MHVEEMNEVALAEDDKFDVPHKSNLGESNDTEDETSEEVVDDSDDEDDGVDYDDYEADEE